MIETSADGRLAVDDRCPEADPGDARARRLGRAHQRAQLDGVAVEARARVVEARVGAGLGGPLGPRRHRLPVPAAPRSGGGATHWLVARATTPVSVAKVASITHVRRPA